MLIFNCVNGSFLLKFNKTIFCVFAACKMTFNEIQPNSNLQLQDEHLHVNIAYDHSYLFISTTAKLFTASST